MIIYKENRTQESLDWSFYTTQISVTVSLIKLTTGIDGYITLALVVVVVEQNFLLEGVGLQVMVSLLEVVLKI